MNVTNNKPITVDSLLFNSAKSQSSAATGTTVGGDITVFGNCEPSLLNLSLVEYSLIFRSLDLRDIRSLEQVCTHLSKAVKDDNALAKAWFRRLPSSHQYRLSQTITAKNDQQFHSWLESFINDQALVKSMSELRMRSKYVPALLFFTKTVLMSQCEKFNLVTKEINCASQTFESAVQSASLSADSRHLMINGYLRTEIYVHMADELWTKKATIPHESCLTSAVFSPDGHHLLITTRYAAEIYVHRADESWAKKATISHDDRVHSAIFSPDSHHVVTASHDRRARVYGLMDDGSWKQEAIIRHSGPVLSAIFSNDGRHVVTNDLNFTRKTGQIADGSWEYADSINLGGASFSPDGRHVLAREGFEAKIFISDEAGESWLKKATIPHEGLVTSATFSPDGLSVLTVSKDGMVKICGQKTDGSWEQVQTFRHDGTVKSATFSPDGRYVVTACSSGTVKIYGQKADESWEQKAIFDHGHREVLVRFGPDGRHMVIYGDIRTAKIIGQQTDGTWSEKAGISHNNLIRAAFFSSDGSYVVTVSRDARVKITELRMSDRLFAVTE